MVEENISVVLLAIFNGRRSLHPDDLAQEDARKHLL